MLGPSRASVTSRNATESREGREEREHVVEGGGDRRLWGKRGVVAADKQVGLGGPLDAGVWWGEQDGEVDLGETEPSAPPTAAVTDRGAEEERCADEASSEFAASNEKWWREGRDASPRRDGCGIGGGCMGARTVAERT